MARQKTQPAQHCFSWSDFGACRAQPSVAFAVIALAQQLVFLVWETGVCVGTTASAIEPESRRVTKTRNAARIRKFYISHRWLFNRVFGPACLHPFLAHPSSSLVPERIGSR